MQACVFSWVQLGTGAEAHRQLEAACAAPSNSAQPSRNAAPSLSCCSHKTEFGCIPGIKPLLCLDGLGQVGHPAKCSPSYGNALRGTAAGHPRGRIGAPGYPNRCLRYSCPLYKHWRIGCDLQGRLGSQHYHALQAALQAFELFHGRLSAAPQLLVLVSKTPKTGWCSAKGTHHCIQAVLQPCLTMKAPASSPLTQLAYKAPLLTQLSRKSAACSSNGTGPPSAWPGRVPVQESRAHVGKKACARLVESLQHAHAHWLLTGSIGRRSCPYWAQQVRTFCELSHAAFMHASAH